MYSSLLKHSKLNCLILNMKQEYNIFIAIVIAISFAIAICSFYLQISFVSGQAVGHEPIIDFCAGSNFACGLFIGDRIKCFGESTSFGFQSGPIGISMNQLGDNLPYLFFYGYAYPGSISCGGNHFCIKDYYDEYFICFGKNDYGQCGIKSDFSEPAEEPEIPSIGFYYIYSISTGYQHTCIYGDLSRDRPEFRCIGRNNFGQLGLGHTNDIGKDQSKMGDNLPKVDLGTYSKFSFLQSGPMSYHTCVVLITTTKQNLAKCWGLGTSGQLGYGDTNNRGDNSNEMGNKLPFIDFGTESNVLQITLGATHTCVQLQNFILKCFGSGIYGQLGSGSTSSILSKGNIMPSVVIDNELSVISVSAGEFHTCILLNDFMTIKCVGRNHLGQLGQGDIINRGDTPSNTIPKIPSIDFGYDTVIPSKIVSGASFTCILFSESSIKCFGDNQYGQLASGTNVKAIGDAKGEMGYNLKYAYLFPPSVSPSKAPTFTPTRYPIAVCSDLITQQDCENDFRCIWTRIDNNNKDICVQFDCRALNKRRKCEDDSRCTWFNNKQRCVLFDCISFSTRSQCRRDSRCKWRGEKCNIRDSEY